jgi:hypothetical protein
LGATSKSLKFLGVIQGQEVVILVDYGSSHSFLNVKLASTISGASPFEKLSGQFLGLIVMSH